MSIPDDCCKWRLRYAGTCAICAAPQQRGARAYWSPSARAVFCIPCVEGAELALARAGTAGAGAAREHARRAARDAERRRRRSGKLAPLAELLSAPKQSTEAWAKGAIGEERLAAFLERELAGQALLLHDRRIPGRRSNIDHVAVGPAGIWVIDAKRYEGTVRKRDVGGWFRSDVRVYVGGRDRTPLVRKMAAQVEAVRAALASAPGLAGIPVRAAVCFTASDWGFLDLGRPFQIDGVLVTFPGALRDAIRTPEIVQPDTIGRIAARLAVELAPA